MVEFCRRLDFAEESLARDRKREIGRQNLDGHQFVFELEITGEIHRGGSTVAELALDRVAIAEVVVRELRALPHDLRPLLGAATLHRGQAPGKRTAWGALSSVASNDCEEARR